VINFSADRKFVLSKQLGDILLANKLTVTTVESCTGGGVAHAITHVSGSSQWFEKAWVTYSNDAKHTEVGVRLETLASYGAVSEEVVIEMAQGARNVSKADLALSISGIAGPTGGTDAKPVGLVWFAVASASETISCFRKFSGDRELVREQAIVLGLEKLIECASY